jgi:hypothetical protein
VVATVLTLSPRESLSRVEQLIRSRVERDGIAALAASTDDDRQLRQLRRLAYRLAADERLDCTLGEHGDGATWLTVFARTGRDSRRGLGYVGSYRGEPVEIPDYSGSIDP